MFIDVHAHHFPREYVERLAGGGKRTASNAAHARLAGLGLSQRLELMSQIGIDVQLLSVSSMMPDLPDPRGARDAAALANDLFAELCDEASGRLGAFGALPLPHVDLAIAEAHRCLDVLGMWGVTVGCSPAGRGIDDPTFAPLFEDLNALGAVVFLHPEGRATAEVADLGLTWSFGALIEDTLAALRLIKRGVLQRWPNIRFIIPHLGGVLPMLIERLSNEIVEQDLTVKSQARGQNGTIWFDTVNGDPSALRCASAVFGVGRLLFGSDFPFVANDDYASSAAYVRKAGFTDGELRSIFGGNAEELFLRGKDVAMLTQTGGAL